jgi:hypothetical protein
VGGSLILEVDHMEAHKEATEEDVDDAVLQEEQLNVVREDGDNEAIKRDLSILDIQHTETRREATKD